MIRRHRKPLLSSLLGLIICMLPQQLPAAENLQIGEIHADLERIVCSCRI